MLKIKLSEETRFTIILIMALLSLPLLLFLLDRYLGDKKTTAAAKETQKTVIVTESKQSDTPQKPPDKAAVSTVRDAIKQGNFSTAYMEISKTPKDSPENEELRKQLSEEEQKRKAPGVRKEAGISQSAPIRYFDESTPRDRSIDAIYVYFVDISGTLWPHFCIQAVARRPLGITGFAINADSKLINITASAIKTEHTGKGIAEWYDVPLDQRAYETVQAMIRAKRVTLTVIGTGGKTTRTVTDNEKKGFSRILEGYAALGGNLNYIQDTTAAPRKHTKR